MVKPKSKAGRVHNNVGRKGAASERPRMEQKVKVIPRFNIFYCQQGW